MRYSRLTLTINNIPMHSTIKKPKYTSTRLTVYLFGGQPNNLNDYKLLLVSFTEEQIGYDLSDWWFEADINVSIREATPPESKGLGFYRAICVYENEKGEESASQKFDVHNKNFGREV